MAHWLASQASNEPTAAPRRRSYSLAALWVSVTACALILYISRDAMLVIAQVDRPLYGAEGVRAREQSPQALLLIVTGLLGLLCGAAVGWKSWRTVRAVLLAVWYGIVMGAIAGVQICLETNVLMVGAIGAGLVLMAAMTAGAAARREIEPQSDAEPI